MIRYLPLLFLFAWAQSLANTSDFIEEVVVYADFRDTDISNLAGSASVLRPNEQGTIVQHLDQVLAWAPNVNLASGGSRSRFIQIRGVGERSQYSDPLNSSVGVIVDGVDLSGVATAATLYDVAQVEVLRGPQGTLYGANALAGLINIVTYEPTETHTGSVQVDAGNYDAAALGVVLSGPLSERLGYRVSAQRYTDDGFTKNDFLGRDDTGEHDEGSYRAKLIWRGEDLVVGLNVGRIDLDNGFDSFSLDNNRTTLSDEPGQDQLQTNYAALNLNWSLNDVMALQASYGFSKSDSDYGYDEDWAFDGFDPIGYSSADRYVRTRDTQSLDLRLLSQPGQGLSGGVWDWVVGLYQLHQDVDLLRQYTYLPGPFRSHYEIDRTAVYGELTRGLGAAWVLTLGARIERHSSEYRDVYGIEFDPEDDLVGGRVLLERDFADGGLFYAGLTRGYKAGGFNIDGSLAADLRQYDPEVLWNIELGYKNTLFDDRLSLRATIFRMQREDVQTPTSTTRPIVGTGAVEFIDYVGNAAEGVNQGIELELVYAATEELGLFANVGLLDTEFEDYIDNGGRDLDGREQAHAPSYQFFVGAQWQINPNWTFRVEVEGRDEFYFSNGHDEESRAYELVNVSLGYETARWSARFWGRNLGDESYFVRGFFFGNDPRDFYTARAFTQLGEPRRYGLSVRFNW